LEATEREIRSRLGPYIYGYLDAELPAIILEHINEIGARMTVREIGNAGRLANAFFEVAPADAVMRGASVEAYASRFEADIDLLTEAERLADADRGISDDAVVVMINRVTPGDSADRANGEIAIVFRIGDHTHTHQQRIGAPAHEIRRRATMAALDFLWRCVRSDTGSLQG
jgi:nicotinamide mononucleotide (NMN) deamidase PncC